MKPQTTPGPTPDDPRRFWDQRFAEAGWAYGSEPNDYLRAKARDLPPGEALCLAEGEGRNAVFLAELGHAVIAQDISAVGLSKARALAASKGLSLDTHCCDLADYQPRPASMDLVVAIWMHLPPPLRQQVHQRAVQALRPGGHLILEAYTPRQLELGSGGPPRRELLLEPEQLQLELQGLELLELQECRRWIEEGAYHHGDSAVVQALARKPG